MRAIVIGGGVAGSAGAIALRRIGADVTVYEAYPDPAGPVGTFLSLAVNGLRALDALGCLEAVQAAGFPVARQRLWSGRGKLLGDTARGRTPHDSLHSVTIRRADLVTALRTQAQRMGARIITGERLDHRGTDPRLAEADLIVGADGIWSTTRTALNPDAPGPRYAGLYTVSGTADPITPATSAGTGVDPRAFEADCFNMVFGRHGAFIHMPRPDGTLWWSAQVAAPRAPARLAEVDVPRLTELYAAEPQVLAVLAATRDLTGATLHHVLPHTPRRHDGRRTVLIGDAAHPVGAGQGASMAIEDAVVLAQRIHATPDDLPAALAAFDAARDARLGKMAKAARSNRDAKTAGPIAARARDVMMPVFTKLFYDRATAWLYTFELGEPALPDAALDQTADAM